jgi:hypothetical protein
MSIYVGIDVHRKRSQVAVIDEGGKVLANRNVPNGAEPVLPVIGGLPAGTPLQSTSTTSPSTTSAVAPSPPAAPSSTTAPGPRPWSAQTVLNLVIALLRQRLES